MAGGRRGSRPAERDLGARDPGTGERGFGPGIESQEAEGDDRAGRRRTAKIQRPNLRISRSRPDYDNDPWPSADEVDGISDDQYWSELSSDKPLATRARAAQGVADTGSSWPVGDNSGEPGFASAPVQADSRAAGRDRRARRREAADDTRAAPAVPGRR